MDWLKLVEEVCKLAWTTYHKLGVEGKVEVERTSLRKRQSAFEEKVALDIYKMLVSLDISCILEPEGNQPIWLSSYPDHIIRIDQCDGTIGEVRYPFKRHPWPVATVVSVFPCKEETTFGEITAAGVVNLPGGQCWLAAKNEGAYYGEFKSRKSSKRFFTIDNSQHLPVVGFNPYYLENRVISSYLPKRIECFNGPAVIQSLIDVATGESNLYFCGLPGLTNSGQRAIELGTGHLIAMEAGLEKGMVSWALEIRNHKVVHIPLDEVIIPASDEQIPIVLARNARVAERFIQEAVIPAMEEYPRFLNEIREAEIHELIRPIRIDDLR